ncbi:MAG: helix-turn-helix transcriptional regulator [Candidatus Binatia bacterium]
MSETAKSPFEPLIEAIADRVAVKIGALNSDNSLERLLTAEEAAQLLSVSPDWLYRHAKRLPFSRKLGPKMLRFSYQGILKWLATRKPS